MEPASDVVSEATEPAEEAGRGTYAAGVATTRLVQHYLVGHSCLTHGAEYFGVGLSEGWQILRLRGGGHRGSLEWNDRVWWECWIGQHWE